MPAKGEIYMEGGDVLARRLKALKDEALAQRIMLQALNFAVTPAVNELRGTVRVGRRYHKTYKGRYVAPGFASRNIKKKGYKGRQRAWVFVHLGPTKEAFYINFFEDMDKAQLRAFNASKHIVYNRFRQRVAHNIKRAVKK